VSGVSNVHGAKRAIIDIMSESRYTLISIKRTLYALNNLGSPCTDMARLSVIEHMVNRVLDYMENMVEYRPSTEFVVEAYSMLRVARALAETAPPEIRQSLASLENMTGYLLSFALDYEVEETEEVIINKINEKIEKHNKKAFKIIKEMCTKDRTKQSNARTNF